MELLLQHGFLDEETFQGTCFNPCFNGTSTSTHLHKGLHPQDKRVSILVLMELLLQLRDGYKRRVPNT